MQHYIIVKYNSLATDKDKLFRDISNLFYKAKAIQGVYDVTLHRSVIDMANRCDLMIVVEMDRDALAVFDSSDIHKEWKTVYSKFIESKAIFDCD